MYYDSSDDTFHVIGSDGTELIPTPATVPIIKAIRVDCGTIASATPSLVIPVTWDTPFADNNYTLTYGIVILETVPAAASTELIAIGSVELAASGTGFSFAVMNQSSAPHHIIAQFIAIHD
jgi:hypothetical protein